MSIHEISDKIKSELGSTKGYDIAIVFIVILVGIVSFFLGRYSISENNASKVIVTIPNEGNLASVVSAEDYDGSYEINEAKADSISQTLEKGAFLASKNGTKYYPAGCSSANRIKEENKVWFRTEEEAIKAGLTRTSTCK